MTLATATPRTAPSTAAMVQMSWCLGEEEDISCLCNLCVSFYDRKSVKMAEPRVLIGGKFAFDFVIQSSSPKKLLQGLKSVLCCKTSPKKTTKGFCRLDILSSSSTKKSFPNVTLGDTISQSRSGLLQSFLGQAHEGCHSSAQCPFALDPAENCASDKFLVEAESSQLVS